MKNLKSRKKNIKFDYIKVELFFIEARKKTANYEFELAKKIKVYLIFHILLLKLESHKTPI